MAILKDFAKGVAKGFIDEGLKSIFGQPNDSVRGDGASGFNSQNMISSLNKSGVAHSGHFTVQLQPKRILGGESDMIYRAESAELPGRSLATVDHRFDNYAPIARVVTGQTYTDVAVTFLLSEDLREKEYFEKWQESAVGTGAFSAASAKTTNNVRYYEDYAGTITLRQYGANGNLRSVHILENAYPLVLGGVQMNWADEGFARLTVSFSYQRYKVMFYRQDQARKGISAGFFLGKGGFSGSVNIPGIGTFGKSGGRTGFDLSPGAFNLGKKIFNSLPT